MVDDMMYVVWVEVLQDRDNDCAIGDDGHVGDTPAGVVLANQGHFIATSYLAFLKE